MRNMGTFDSCCTWKRCAAKVLFSGFDASKDGFGKEGFAAYGGRAELFSEFSGIL